ncbi:MAG: GNAT family N-acetyltransferase [Croceitalea sp.]|nr:GNAT family N-acetyltransferase [Croceitalea sp.]NNC33303.1 GNAT family N-acetyltransferase [Croceitalea sp.]NNL08199.1 GNAT family N-acetyltransferase [Croceitalea sp.]
MIRTAKISEIVDILAITKACASHMIERGIFQWNQHYPSEQAFLKDVQRNELFIKIEKDTLIGAIVISTHMDEEYGPIDWLTPNDNNIYIHRLCVHPVQQGKGHAQALMDFAEKYAREQLFTSVRLDTFSQNKRNQKFYEARGYKRLGDIFFPKQSEHPFHCYELVL